MNKIAVVGISGSGKSTVARKLAEKTDLPLFHMDQLFWKGNWEAIPEADYLIGHKELINKPKWIIEGYVDEKMSDRLKMADLVLYLDYSGVRSVWHVLRRWLKHRKESRPEIPAEAREKLKLKFLWVVLTQGERKGIEEAIKLASPQNIKRFRSPASLERFLL